MAFKAHFNVCDQMVFMIFLVGLPETANCKSITETNATVLLDQCRPSPRSSLGRFRSVKPIWPGDSNASGSVLEHCPANVINHSQPEQAASAAPHCTVKDFREQKIIHTWDERTFDWIALCSSAAGCAAFDGGHLWMLNLTMASHAELSIWINSLQIS